MPPNQRRSLSGAFAAVDLRHGAWRLTQGEPPGIDVYLKGDIEIPYIEIADLDIEWGARSVLLTFTAGGGRRSVEAASAIVHEPNPHVYDRLPLAQFEPQARRFWRRVFRIVQLPGGRHLLGMFARRR
jgi:hypothetical protein